MKKANKWATGTSYNISYSPAEMFYKLFRKKRCPICGNKMKSNFTNEYMGIGVAGFKAKYIAHIYEYQQYYFCERCDQNFPISELVNKSRAKALGNWGITVRKINTVEIDKLNPLFRANDQELFMSQRVDKIRSGICDIYILEKDNAVVGEVTIIYNERQYDDYTIPEQRVYAEALRVLPEYQGRGFGQLLMKEVMKKVKAEGYTEMTIGVEDDNLNAKHIYKKLGFTEFIRRDVGSFEQDRFEYDVFMNKL